jgi:ribosome-binding factor A
MSKERIQKINSLLKKEISQIILRELNFSEKTFVTVVSVEVSKDLQIANVFISVFPEEEEKKAMQDLQKNIYHIQKILDKKLKMKPVPKIVFKTVKLIDIVQNLEKE